MKVLRLQITTMRELVNLVQEHETKPFASLDPNRPGIRDPNLGPKQRPGDVILAVVNIMRNWAAACTENLDFMARHPTMLSVILRISSIASRRADSTVRPASPILSLSDLITIRKDVSYILFGVTAELRLKGVYEKSPIVATRMTRRILELVSSSLIDPLEICAPSAHSTVPYVADNALQIWTRFSQPDDHRKIICGVIPQYWLWQLFEVLVYRLPVTTRDYECHHQGYMVNLRGEADDGYLLSRVLGAAGVETQDQDRQALGFPRCDVEDGSEIHDGSESECERVFSMFARGERSRP